MQYYYRVESHQFRYIRKIVGARV